MDDLGKLLTIGLAILALATAAGFGWQKGRIGNLQGRLDDSDKELERETRRREDAQTELETYKTTANAEIAQLKTDLAALTRVVTGEAHWVAIGAQLDTHHREAQQQWRAELDLLGEIRDRLPGSAR